MMDAPGAAQLLLFQLLLNTKEVQTGHWDNSNVMEERIYSNY